MGGVLSRGGGGREGGSGGGQIKPAGSSARAGGGGKDAAALLGEVLSAAIATGFLVWGLKITLSYMDPYREGRKEAKRQAAALRQRLGRSIELNEYEMLLASSVLNPATIRVSLDDIGGLEGIKEDMRLKVLRPLSEPATFCTTLWRPVKGVLFYGPPGTGKTMLAKALAAESRCFFLNVTASSVMSKWYGDANRFIRAIFTLAAKLQPCVVFIDEVDAFLTKRGAHSEHEATLQAKTEFMQLWDGMEGARGSRVLVMGATNRPWMVDEAVLRRFALQYEIGLPTHAERIAILRNYLMRHQADTLLLQRDGRLAEGEGGVELELLLGRPLGAPPSLAPCPSSSSRRQPGGRQPVAVADALDPVAAATEGYSGSDLMELAAQAAQDVLVQHWAAAAAAHSSSSRPASEQQQQHEASSDAAPPPLRALGVADLLVAADAVRPGVSRAAEYNLRSSASLADGASLAGLTGLRPGSSSSGGGDDGGMVQQFMAAAAAAAAAAAGSPSPAGQQQRNGGGSKRSSTQRPVDAAAAASDGDGSSDDGDGDGGVGGSAAVLRTAAAAASSPQASAAADEVYKLVGKMVLHSLQGGGSLQ